MAEFLFYRCQW